MRDDIKPERIQEAEMYRGLAISLMQSSTVQDQLDPEIVLSQIPEDWELRTDDYDLVGFLTSLFDQ